MKEYYLVVTSRCWLPDSVQVRAELSRTDVARVYFVETTLPRSQLKCLGGILKVLRDPPPGGWTELLGKFRK